MDEEAEGHPTCTCTPGSAITDVCVCVCAWLAAAATRAVCSWTAIRDAVFRLAHFQSREGGCSFSHVSWQSALLPVLRGSAPPSPIENTRDFLPFYENSHLITVTPIFSNFFAIKRLILRSTIPQSILFIKKCIIFYIKSWNWSKSAVLTCLR